jgi:uncharacterized protein (TIGR03086 family)
MNDSPDPRALLQRACDQAAAVIASVAPDQMTWPTPCEQFDVRTLVGHMLFAARRIRAAGLGEPIPDDGPAVTGIADADWAPAFRQTAAEVAAAWDRPDALAGDVELPFGTFPASVVVSIYALEETTHAWDLAAATSSVVHLDDGLAEAVLADAREIVTPVIRGAEPMPFGLEVAAPAGAPAPDRLAAFMGRHPEHAVAGRS